MTAKGTTATLALLLALASSQAAAAAARPLQLEYAAPSLRPTGIEHLRSAPSTDARPRPAPGFRAGPRAGAEAGAQPGPRLQVLREQALSSVLAAPAAGFEDERPQGALRLKFEKRGNAFRDLNRSYREMCNRVSQKIWDEPNGKRVRFDVAGKPGVGVEIPLGRRRN